MGFRCCERLLAHFTLYTLTIAAIVKVLLNSKLLLEVPCAPARSSFQSYMVTSYMVAVSLF